MKNYNRLYYKTLGENPKHYEYSEGKQKCRGHNLIQRQAYNLGFSTQYFFYSILTQKKIHNYKTRFYTRGRSRRAL